MTWVQRRRACRLLAAAVFAAVLLPVVPAAAHAVLLSAAPPPNVGLGTPPERVTLRLSEPLRLPPSTIRVLDADDVDQVETVRRLPTDPQSMEATLRPLARGVYRVEWRSVSTVDGHTIRGSYLFGVEEAPPGAPPTEESGPLAGSGVLGIAVRVVQNAALLMLLGAGLLALLATRTFPGFASEATRTLPALGVVALTATAATTVTEAVIATGGWAARDWGSFLSGSVAGWARAAALAGAGLALGGAVRRHPILASGFAAGALAAVAISGHAAGTSRPAVSMAANAIHVLVAGIWLGGAATIGLLWRRVRPQREEILALIGRASPYAIGSAILLAGTGIVNAFGQLTGVSDLWGTGYGRAVAAKALALVVAAGLGAWHSFVLRPRLAAARGRGEERPARGIRRAVTGEGAVGALAVALAVLLVAFPDTPVQEARADEQRASLPAIFEVRGEPLVTVGERDGDLVIGLVVAPPEPGPVTFAVQLVPSTPEVSTEDWQVRVIATAPSGTSQVTALAPCGLNCFAGPALLGERGTWRLDVEAEDHRVEFTVPLPAPDGGELLERTRRAWGALRSVQIDERFRGPGDVAIDTRYRYEAPDRSERADSAGRAEITMGERRWRRASPDGDWSLDTTVRPLRAPFPFPWERAERPRVLEDTTLGGRQVHVLVLFDPVGIWYRIAVDPETFRPLEDRMRAIGHFMDRAYSRFNENLDIKPPGGERGDS